MAFSQILLLFNSLMPQQWHSQSSQTTFYPTFHTEWASILRPWSVDSWSSGLTNNSEKKAAVGEINLVLVLFPFFFTWPTDCIKTQTDGRTDRHSVHKSPPGDRFDPVLSCSILDNRGKNLWNADIGNGCAFKAATMIGLLQNVSLLVQQVNLTSWSVQTHISAQVG